MTTTLLKPLTAGRRRSTVSATTKPAAKSLSAPPAKATALWLSPAAAGIRLTPAEFDAADGERGYRYELFQGTLIVTPAPLIQERDPNGELEFLLRTYRTTHPQGSALNATVAEHDVFIGDDRRRADRVIWAGLGRLPRVDEVPTIAIEFVSEGRKSFSRDYEDKRRAYRKAGVLEYWVFNRFDHTLTVFKQRGAKRVFDTKDVFTTPLLPGFELPLAQLFEYADRWEK